MRNLSPFLIFCMSSSKHNFKRLSPKNPILTVPNPFRSVSARSPTRSRTASARARLCPRPGPPWRRSTPAWTAWTRARRPWPSRRPGRGSWPSWGRTCWGRDTHSPRIVCRYSRYHFGWPLAPLFLSLFCVKRPFEVRFSVV